MALLDRLSLSVIVSSLLLSFSITHAAAETLPKQIRVTVGDWKPYISSDMPDKGFAAEILKEALASQAVRVNLSFVPWKRAKEFNFSLPVVSTKNVFFYPANKTFDWHQYQDLHDKRVGWVDGYAISDGFIEARKKNWFKLIKVQTDLIGFRMLLNGRIDVFPASLLVGRQILSENFSKEQRQQIRFHPKALTQRDLHFIVSKKHPKSQALIRAFNRGYRQLVISGRLKQVITQRLGLEYIDVIPVAVKLAK